jgi:nicotinamidase-related amidase
MYWRQMDLPVIHVRHSSTNPDSRLHASHPGFAFNPHVQPQAGETVITKSVNSAFIGADLKERIDAIGSHTLVIAGLTTDHCVSTTARMAGNYGYDTYLVADAIATFDKIGVAGEHFEAGLIHQTALASLKDEFATIMDSARLLAMLAPPTGASPA